jgi:hypothetical protein
VLFSKRLGCLAISASITVFQAFPVMKVFSSTCTFDYSWDEVTTANWRKYCPWNDKSTHVVAVDTISRTVDPKTGIVGFPLNIIILYISDEMANLNVPISCVRNASSHVINQYRNGFSHCSGEALLLMYTKSHMLILVQRRSLCAQRISRGLMS